VRLTGSVVPILLIALAGPSGASAHEAWDVTAGRALPPPLELLGLCGAGALYACGLYRRRQHRGHSTARWRALAFAGGLFTLAVALSPSLDRIAERLLVAHMGQHLLLSSVAAPLLALGRPLSVMRWAGPRIARLARGTSLVVRAVLNRGWFVWTAHVATLWVWHVPRFYEAAVHDPVLHGLEHSTLVGTALLFWSMLTEPGARWRLGFGAAMVLLFAAGIQCSVLGALLTFAEQPWYGHYAMAAPALGLDPLEDQHLAGALMWIPGGAVYLVGALAVLASWLNAAARLAR
jgi:putative membrane protein